MTDFSEFDYGMSRAQASQRTATVGETNTIATQRTTHNAQRTTHNAQRTTHNAQENDVLSKDKDN
jgi:hypothetical protein